MVSMNVGWRWCALVQTLFVAGLLFPLVAFCVHDFAGQPWLNALGVGSTVAVGYLSLLAALYSFVVKHIAPGGGQPTE
jgi:hypothetical protein